MSQLIFLLVIASAFGGGGVAFGLCNLVVQLAGLFVLACNPDAILDFFKRSPRVLVALVIVSLLLPLLQLVPLPADIWSRLPGRDLVQQSLEIIGRGDSWRPFTVEVNRTFVAFLSMLPVLAVLVLVVRLSEREVALLLRFVVLLGLACAAIGGLQLLTANAVGVFFAETVSPDDLYGIFASHNATGLFLDMALVALLSLPRESGGRDGNVRSLVTRIVVGSILIVAIVLTRSRSSMALMLIVLLFGFVRQVLRYRRRQGWGRLAVTIAGVLALAVGGVAIATKSYRVQQSFKRFDNLEDVRPQIWEDARSSAKRFWPVGAGMGSFDEVFQVDESLEYLDAKRAGRAHNDYLEVAIEAGGLGLAVIAGWIGWIAFASWRSLSGRLRWQGGGAGVALLLVVLQSAMDYPLRNQTTLVLVAVFAGILVVASARQSAEAAEN
jgi:O-antigen ligase